MGETKNLPKSSATANRPPVVAVLGHVDHGKTTLLDTIRKTQVASSEHGGITQHIGAYQVTVSVGKKNPEPRTITFIDTPGHEAFAKMRSRGAAVADIAILVVAADDGVKPQTKESITQIKASGVSVIVAVTKMDLPGADLDRVKKDLARNDILVEGYGGEVPVVALSAKTGKGIPELLEMITLVADMHELAGDPAGRPEAVVIETRLDKGKGPVATVVVRNGTYRFGLPLYSGIVSLGRVRAMLDETGARIEAAPPGKPAEILGFSSLPAVGEKLTDAPVGAAAAPRTATKAPLTPDFLAPVDEKRKLRIILKTDTSGSREAILLSLPDSVTVVSDGVGEISDADVLLARSTKAILVGFQVRVPGSAMRLAEAEKVLIRTYTIIYELLAEVAEVAENLEKIISRERELGRGTVLAEFPYRAKRVAGVKVMAGRVAKGDSIRIVRHDQEIGRAKVTSLRRGKEDVSKTEAGGECGLLFDHDIDFQVNDDIIAFTVS